MPSLDPADHERTELVLREGGEAFGRYSLVSCVGEGGMGVVWQARDEKLGRNVALKFLPERVRRDPEAIRDLKRETSRCLDLTHDHVVRVYDFVEDRHAAAIAMEYVDGRSLSAWKAERPGGCFDAADLGPLVAQLCEALDYAHGRAKVVHRDLKPANLLVTRDGVLKVADFGIARSLVETRIRQTADRRGASGTLGYMGPQQLDGAADEPAHDIYGLGATLYDLLTGKAPFFRGDIMGQIRTAAPPSLEARRAELGNSGAPIPGEWELAVLACLAKRSEDRPATAGEVARRLGVISRVVPLQLGRIGLRSPEVKGPQEPGSGPVVSSTVATGSTEATSRCPKCGRSTRDTARHCPSCGESLTEACPKCESRNRIGSRFCEGCGVDLATLAQLADAVAKADGLLQVGEIEAAHGHLLKIKDAARALKIDDKSPLGLRVAQVQRQAEPRQPWTVPDLGLMLMPIAPGTFRMGSEDGDADERPVTCVTLTKGFWLGRTQVTQREWKAVMGSNPSAFKGDNLPVESVSWVEATEFCLKVTERERAAGRLPEGHVYTLPSEAQWEYACRAGTSVDYAGRLDEMAWYKFNSGDTSHPVGKRKSNAWGLHDMHGNVWEWCADWYGEYRGGSVLDPIGIASCPGRVVRGGGWNDPAGRCRSAYRGRNDPRSRLGAVGFRLALSLNSPPA